MSRILITGGAGFIGYFLSARLAQNKANQITLLDNLSGISQPDSQLQKLLGRRNIRFIQGDLLDKNSLLKLGKGYEYIYHLAAIRGVRNVLENPDQVLYVNGISTLNIFEYAKTLKNLQRIFFSSSSEVYAGTMKHFGLKVPTDERVQLTVEDISGDRSTYALSKIYGESAAFVYGRKYKIPVIIGRYHNVYGPRMGFVHVIPETFVKINKSNVIQVPSPGHTRAFCYIDDAVEFTIRACENKNTVNEILHIGNPKEEIGIKDLVAKIAKILGKDITIQGLADTPGSPLRRCPDTAKIERLTGYAAVVALEEGIRKSYAWYKDKLNGAEE